MPATTPDEPTTATRIDPAAVELAGIDRSGELAGELERLRWLVGPSEQAYADLRADVDGARAAAREAAAEAGRLRGELAEMRVELARARQDQDTLQRRHEMGALEHLADLVREGWHEVVRPLVGSLLRALGLRRSDRR
jgi:chromosome segregation ATPase